MKLVIGGYAQGKLKYAIEKYGLDSDLVWDGKLPGEEEIRAVNGEMGRRIPVVNHFHSWVRKRLSEGGCPEQEISIFLEKYQDCIIISDEIGNGIVPIEVFEREYRERTGRILVELAKKAEEVERVICGIGQKIK